MKRPGLHHILEGRSSSVHLWWQQSPHPGTAQIRSLSLPGAPVLQEGCEMLLLMRQTKGAWRYSYPKPSRGLETLREKHFAQGLRVNSGPKEGRLRSLDSQSEAREDHIQGV